MSGPKKHVFVLRGDAPRRSSWQAEAPAVGAVLSRLAELYARALRVEMGHRAKNTAALARAMKRLPP
jgi:hypothetical protein